MTSEIPAWTKPGSRRGTSSNKDEPEDPVAEERTESRKPGGRALKPLERSILFGVFLFLLFLVLESWGQVAFLGKDISSVRSPMIAQGLERCSREIVRFFITVFLLYMFAGMAAGAWAHAAARAAAGKSGWFWPVFFLEILFLLAFACSWFSLHHPQFFAIKPGWNHFPVDFMTAHAKPWMFRVAFALYLGVHGGLFWARYKEKPGRFKAKLIKAAGAAAGVVIAVALLEKPPSWGRGKPFADPARPHLFFYCIDGLRLDRTGRAGYPRKLTPHIDEFMKDAVVFENAFTPLAKTYPSWVCFLTSTGILENQVRFALPGKERRQPPLPTIARVLAQAGWRTSFHTDDSRYSFMEEWTGFQKISQPEPGFMNYFAEYSHYYLLVGLLANTRTGNLLFPMTRHNHALSFFYSPRIFYQDFIADIAKSVKKGLLASFSHHVGIHYPGAAPWPYYALFTDSRYRGGNKYMYRVYFVSDLDRARRSALEDSNQHNQDLYDGMVVMMDEKFGEFIAALKKLGIYEQSLIVLFSDHGEHFNERHPVFRHFLPMHGVHLKDDFQNRCFLAIRFPERFRPRIKKWTVPELVRVMDIAPTVLDFLGLPAPKTFQGVSLLPAILGKAEPPSLEIYMENDINPAFLLEPNSLALNLPMTDLYRMDPGMKTFGVREELVPQILYVKERALRTRDWKVVRVPMITGPDYRLYRPSEDPHHLHDLARQEPQVMKEMMDRLRKYLLPDRAILSRSPEQMGVKRLEFMN